MVLLYSEASDGPEKVSNYFSGGDLNQSSQKKTALEKIQPHDIQKLFFKTKIKSDGSIGAYPPVLHKTSKDNLESVKQMKLCFKSA